MRFSIPVGKGGPVKLFFSFHVTTRTFEVLQLVSVMKRKTVRDKKGQEKVKKYVYTQDFSHEGLAAPVLQIISRMMDDAMSRLRDEVIQVMSNLKNVDTHMQRTGFGMLGQVKFVSKQQ